LNPNGKSHRNQGTNKKKKRAADQKKKIKLSNWPCERGTWTLSIPLKRYSKQIQMTKSAGRNHPTIPKTQPVFK